MKPTDQRQERTDGKGLAIVVGTSGQKSWVVRYKDIHGRSGRETIGTYPELRLSEAREEAVLFKRRVRQGEVTVKARGAPPAVSLASPTGMTVSDAFEAYMDRKGIGLSRPKVRRTNFERHVEPHIGSTLITKLDADTLIAMFQTVYDGMVAKGRTGRGVGNIHTETSAFLSWCRREGRGVTGMKHNPMADVVKIAKAIDKDRALSVPEIKSFWKALPLAGAFAPPIELIFRAALRKGETMQLAKRMVHLEHGLLGPHLDIPGSITKNGMPHLVPLTPQMVALIPALDDLSDDDIIWRSPRKADGPLCDSALSSPMKRILKAMGPIEPWSLHDLRRTASTHMNGMLDERMMPTIPEHVVERILNHIPQGVKAVYNRHGYYAEKAHALAIWNDWLDQIR